ncbi:MAG: amidohydrolase [Desulfobulbus propionicus]|nr:MAG: amidohydrolase [Desulfobulbus propionicus]
MEIHTGEWVVPVAEPPIKNGGVALFQDGIAAVGSRKTLLQAFPEAQCVAHHGAVLTPPLVNAHIHLELSSLKELGQGASPSHFTQWILALVSLRAKRGAMGKEVSNAALKQLKKQYNDGVSAILDIGNTPVVAELTQEFQGFLFPCKEYLGFAGDHLENNVSRLDAEEQNILCTGHALYSTHKVLLMALKNRCKQQDAVFSIHVAETKAEVEMVQQGTGEMVAFLCDRGFWDERFLPEVGASGAVAYLDKLGLLDEQTLCVHCVHLSDGEIELIARKKAHICLCPGSNRFLDVGRAPVQKMVNAGILPALGTDSLASNPEISLWREMQLLAEEHPGVLPETIFSMATLGGAQALGIAATLGTLSRGKLPEMLSIQLPGPMASAEDVMEYLVTTGSAIQPVRIKSMSGSKQWHV